MLNFTEIIEPLKILRLLSRSLPYYLNAWREFDGTTGLFGSIDPQSFNMRQVGSSSPVIEYVVRPHCAVLCILGSFFYLDKTELLQEVLSRQELEEKVRKGVRWACATHLTGSMDIPTFLGRGRWGENWRSSLWATLLGVASLFCGDVLDEEDRAAVRNVLAFEADRFIDLEPPTGCAIDTKLEENAQDAMVLAWAFNLWHDHPHAGAWERTLARWSINCASTIHDRTDHGRFLESSFSRAVTTQNLFPDMTAENHGFFNPEVMAYGSWMVLAMAAFSLRGIPPPDYLLRRNHQRTFDLLLRFGLPNGMVYAPGSHDYPLFIPRPLAFAWGLWNNNARARMLTARLLSWMDTVLDGCGDDQGPWVLGMPQQYDGWELLFQSSVGCELALLAALPFSGDHPRLATVQTETGVDTRHVYPYVEVCYRRNIRTTRSMAWKALGGHPLIGFCVHSQPELLAPVKAGLLGIPQTNPQLCSWDVAFHHDRIIRDGFNTFGRIRYYDDMNRLLLHRDVRVLAWGDEGLAVFDEIVADTQCVFYEQYLSPLYLVNDHWTGGAIDLFSGSLHETFSTAQRRSREVQCPSYWAGIGTRMVFQFIWGRSKGLHYLPGNGRNAPGLWKNCRLDTLAVHVEAQDAAAGTVVYRLGFFVGIGKGPRSFKTSGTAGEFFRGLVVMDGKITAGLD
ncbi:MAG: hypothetical protein JW768_07905 [Chitinispirillaceae bacterium]|nr:hypothetical protein [Chitinispirillaceae bacterium]